LTRTAALSEKDVGWKLHISINDKGLANLIKGWNLVKNILIDNEIKTFKVIKPNQNLCDDAIQCGKQITIYQFRDERTLQFWQELIEKIEAELTQAGVEPDKKAPIDEPIFESHFFSYRSDEGESGKYISSKDAKSFNPSNKLDPFSKLNEALKAKSALKTSKENKQETSIQHEKDNSL
jgi:hypothetical protein